MYGALLLSIMQHAEEDNETGKTQTRTARQPKSRKAPHQIKKEKEDRLLAAPGSQA